MRRKNHSLPHSNPRIKSVFKEVVDRAKELGIGVRGLAEILNLRAATNIESAHLIIEQQLSLVSGDHNLLTLNEVNRLKNYMDNVEDALTDAGFQERIKHAMSLFTKLDRADFIRTLSKRHYGTESAFQNWSEGKDLGEVPPKKRVIVLKSIYRHLDYIYKDRNLPGTIPPQLYV